MLLLLTGASGVGKSTTLLALRDALHGEPVTCVEFDSVGVPADADTAWRHRVVEQWVRRALCDQHAGRHLLLCGQVPVGELLAAPSADQLDGIAVLVLHCSPEIRRARLQGRGYQPALIDDHVAFGEWFLRHTLDPAYRPSVIRVPSCVPMRWDRWQHWRAGDERWDFEILDTDQLTRQQTGDHVIGWAQDVLAGQLQTLTPGWANS